MAPIKVFGLRLFGFGLDGLKWMALKGVRARLTRHNNSHPRRGPNTTVRLDASPRPPSGHPATAKPSRRERALPTELTPSALLSSA